MKRRFKGRRAPRGMTLIEIMVVLVILGLIAGAVTVAVIPRINEARVDRTKLDIGNLENGLKLYYARTGKFPDTATGFKVLLDMQILDRPPKDAWGSRTGHGVAAGFVVEEVTASGFTLVKVIEDWPGRGPLKSYCAVFRKPEAGP